jgi:hypothetical protein
MDTKALLIDAFGRIEEEVDRSLAGIDASGLAYRPDPTANSIGWLIWHLTRVADMHIAEIRDVDQLWVSDGWATRFGLEPDPWNVGYGHAPEQVAAIQPDGTQVLQEYWDAVWARTREVLAETDPTSLDEIIDRRWDPPVTLGVRLVSIADDAIQHAGQAAYVKGLLERR